MIVTHNLSSSVIQLVEHDAVNHQTLINCQRHLCAVVSAVALVLAPCSGDGCLTLANGCHKTSLSINGSYLRVRRGPCSSLERCISRIVCNLQRAAVALRNALILHCKLHCSYLDILLIYHVNSLLVLVNSDSIDIGSYLCSCHAALRLQTSGVLHLVIALLRSNLEHILSRCILTYEHLCLRRSTGDGNGKLSRSDGDNLLYLLFTVGSLHRNVAGLKGSDCACSSVYLSILGRCVIQAPCDSLARSIGRSDSSCQSSRLANLRCCIGYRDALSSHEVSSLLDINVVKTIRSACYTVKYKVSFRT